jgi:hypothetical protein
VAMWLSSNRPKMHWPNSEHDLAVELDAETEARHLVLQHGH